jgi:siderophore synthetase component
VTIDTPDAVEDALLVRVLSTLIREDVFGLRTRSTVTRRDDGDWLRLPAADGTEIWLPVDEDGFQSEFAARAPVVRTEPDGRELTGGRVLARLAGFVDAEDQDGFAAFTGEYHDALAALRLTVATHRPVMARLAASHGTDCARWQGQSGALAFDTLAARAGHPLYPTGAARPGLSPADLHRYAPEFAPRFALRWLAVPTDALAVSPELDIRELLDGHWPRPGDVGLSGLDDTHTAVPVHPLTAAGPLPEALHAAGLHGGAVLAERSLLDVLPTLSMRTVAVTDHPDTHLKLPLATATLGRLNRRTIKPGTLSDGALVGRLLETVAAHEPRLRGRILHADESRYLHAGHELLAVLVRQQPAGLDDCTVLPLAALTAAAPDGRPVLDHLAGRFFGGDAFCLLEAVLSLLLDWQTTLLGYGIALESHQQNISLVLDRPPGRRARVRLLFKDDDGPRIHHARLRAALGAGAPAAGDFADQRALVDDDRRLLEVFTTITLHLCAGAFAHGLAARGLKDRLLDLIRDLLDQAARRLGQEPGGPGAALRAHTLEADRLPVKAMLTAGTLLTKERSGACDINKHYTTGPNYLARGQR